jgi:hypothetical protein
VSPPTGSVFDIGGLRLTVTAITVERLEVELAPVPPRTADRPP